MNKFDKFYKMITESFNNDKGYAIETMEPIPLENGYYKGGRYGYVIEINGKTYKTKQGIRCGSIKMCGGLKKYLVQDGKIFECEDNNFLK